MVFHVSEGSDEGFRQLENSVLLVGLQSLVRLISLSESYKGDFYYLQL